MGRGGARPGAGRPRRGETAASRQFEDALAANGGIANLVQKLVELANGVALEKDTEDGPVVYRTPPHYGAASYLIDRLLGKPHTNKPDDDRGGAITLRIDLGEERLAELDPGTEHEREAIDTDDRAADRLREDPREHPGFDARGYADPVTDAWDD